MPKFTYIPRQVTLAEGCVCDSLDSVVGAAACSLADVGAAVVGGLLRSKVQELPAGTSRYHDMADDVERYGYGAY